MPDETTAGKLVDVAVPLRLARLTNEICFFHKIAEPISGRVNRASATETVAPGSIAGGVKPKTIKISIYSFPT